MRITKLKMTTASAAALVALMGTFGAAALADSYPQEGGVNQKNGPAAHNSNRNMNRGGHMQLRNFSENRGDNNFGHRHHGHRGFGGINVDIGSGCSFSYRKWQATGSRYWRERYYDCAG